LPDGGEIVDETMLSFFYAVDRCLVRVAGVIENNRQFGAWEIFTPKLCEFLFETWLHGFILR
jgi:hypothetical protein